MHGSRVNDPVFELDVRILTRYVLTHLEEEPLGVFQNVGLVGECDLLATVLPCVLKRVSANALRAEPRDDHHGLSGRPGIAVHPDVVLDTDVQSLGVLANQNEVDILVPAARHDGAHRANVRKPAPDGVVSGPLRMMRFFSEESSVA